MKSFRFYIDIDAENEEAAREELIEQMVAYPLVDMPVEEKDIPSWQKENKITLEDLAKFLKIDDPQSMDILDIQSHFCDYDAWLCLHCKEDVGNDQRDMIRHLLKHTLEELKRDDDGDLIEEEEEE